MSKLATEQAKKKLIVREGLRRKVYKDSRGFPTVGIGHLVTPSDNLKLGDVITNEQINEFFERDIQYALKAAQIQANELEIHGVDFLAALISVNFQLGPKWHLPKVNGGKGFVTTYRLLKERKFQEAISNLKKSAWYYQTPTRVQDFIASILNIHNLTNHKETT